MSQLGRLLWRCRRGTKELDLLLERYVRREYSRATAAEQGAFAQLLDLPDPLLTDYLLGYATPDQLDVACVVTRIATDSQA